MIERKPSDERFVKCPVYRKIFALEDCSIPDKNIRYMASTICPACGNIHKLTDYHFMTP